MNDELDDDGNMGVLDQGTFKVPKLTGKQVDDIIRVLHMNMPSLSWMTFLRS